MITVYYKNDSSQGCVIRPTPLVSISTSPIRNGLASFGNQYTITLTGTLIAHEGSPIYTDNGDGTFGPNDKFNQIGPNWETDGSTSRPNGQAVNMGNRLDSILTKQHAIRELFAIDGQKMEISPITGDAPNMVFYPNVESISFDEGLYVDICRFTVTLTATAILDQNGAVFTDGIQGNVSAPIFGSGDANGTPTANYQISAGTRLTEKEILDRDGGFVSDVQDSWSLEPDESLGNTTADGRVIPLGYRLSRTITAQGITKYIGEFGPEGDTAPPKRYEAWRMAKGYVLESVIKTSPNDDSGSHNYPFYTALQQYGSGVLDLEGFSGYSHSRTESIDQAGGSYSLTDNWVLASGTTAFEQYDMSISSSTDAAYNEVSINGTIRGAIEIPASGQASPLPNNSETPYQRALTKYNEISNNGIFGVGSDVYKRANNATEYVLNSQPRSISLATNEFTGEITYSLSFDNRPTNIFTDVMSESIDVTDTSPGDVFASIPVLGRTTGPVLQYVDTRTEYQRSLSINIQLGSNQIGYGSNRANLLMTKPSLQEPLRSELNNTIAQMSPANEPGVVKYFVGPPSENWNPRTGAYSVTINWTYELDS